MFDNIQVTISNVYFRFEDELYNTKLQKHEGFSMGLLLKEFSVRTSETNFESMTELNEDGTPKNNLTSKKVKLTGFSIFCDWD